MKRALILLTASLLSFTFSFSQTPRPIDTTFKQVLDTTQYSFALDTTFKLIVAQIRDADRLVSEYTFRNLARNDYSLLLTGEGNKTTIGRYAALALDKDAQTVSITPVAIIPGNDPVRKPFHWLHSVDVSLTLNGNNIFNFGDRKKASTSYSLTYTNAAYKFHGKCCLNKTRRKPEDNVYIKLYASILADFKGKNKGLTNLKDTLDFRETAKDSLTLVKAYMEKVKEYEEKLTAGIWNTKSIWWVKLTATPFSIDYLDVIGVNDTASHVTPVNKLVYTPSLQLSFSHYWAYRKAGHLYLTMWAKAGLKHSLSEIYSTSQWNQVNRLSDSIFITKDAKAAYYVENTDISTRLVPDFGGQAIYFAPAARWLGNVSVGLDVASSFSGFAASKDDGTAYAHTGTVGFLIAAKDKDGKATINIEPFYERKTYINYQAAARSTWGIKFSVPFNRLFDDAD